MTQRRILLAGGCCAAATLALAWACGGSAGPVAVTLPSGPTGACAALSAALPSSLDGHSRRPTKPASDRVWAWGSPAIVLTCGVTVPSATTGTHLTDDGVTWRTASDGSGKAPVTWTSVGLSTGLRLDVPSSIDDQEGVLGDLAPAILKAVPGAASAASATPGTPPTASTPHPAAGSSAPTGPTSSS